VDKNSQIVEFLKLKQSFIYSNCLKINYLFIKEVFGTVISYPLSEITIKLNIMKNLFLGAFMLAFTAVASAQTTNATQTTTPATTQQAPANTAQPVQNNAAQPAAAATTTQQPATMAEPATATASASQEDYSKIQQSQIAPAVLKTAVAKYKDYSLVEALIAQDGSNYKLVLTKDGKDVAAYYKSNGEFIKEETV